MNWKLSDAEVIKLLYLRYLVYGQSPSELFAAYKRDANATSYNHAKEMWHSIADFIEKVIK